MVTVRAVPVDGPDALAVVDVARRSDPGTLAAADEFGASAERDPRHLLLLGVSDGVPSAAAQLEAIHAWDEPQDMWLWAWIPDGAHARVGEPLWDALMRHARAHDVGGLRTVCPANRAAHLAYLSGHGFREVERNQRVLLRLAAPPPPVDPPPDMRIVTLAQEPGLLGSVIALDAEAIPDIPGEEGVQAAVQDEAWWRRELASGALRPETVVMAVGDAGGAPRVLSYTVLRHPRGRPEAALHEFTGTLRAARGRGLAVLVKRALLPVAWAAGVRELHAWNHLDNGPMRAVNARLGYVRGPDDVQLRVRLPR